MKLFFRDLGAGLPIIILHGLLGSSDNWLTQARLLSSNHKVYFLDQRNHGQSPHSNEHSYVALTEDLREFIQDHQVSDPVIIGHSMGGKTAMSLALMYPNLLSTLIVVDSAPKAYPIHHDHVLEGLIAIPIRSLSSRNEADRILANYVPEPEVRQFLLKNLARKPGGGFTWKANLTVLNETLPQIVDNINVSRSFDKPTLFIRGSRSDYILDSDWPLIQKIFPNAKLITMETGHWVQAEKPQEFVDTVTNFLNEK